MTQSANTQLESFEKAAETSQIQADATRAALDEAQKYSSDLGAEYRTAVNELAPMDRLVSLAVKRQVTNSVVSDLEDAYSTASSEADSAAEALRHATRLHRALQDMSPQAQRLITAWEAGTLPHRVRIGSGEFSPSSLVSQYVDNIRRNVRTEDMSARLEDLAMKVVSLRDDGRI